MRDPKQNLSRALAEWTERVNELGFSRELEELGLELVAERAGWGFEWTPDAWQQHGEVVSAHAYVWPTGILERGSRAKRGSMILELELRYPSAELAGDRGSWGSSSTPWIVAAVRVFDCVLEHRANLRPSRGKAQPASSAPVDASTAEE